MTKNVCTKVPEITCTLVPVPNCRNIDQKVKAHNDYTEQTVKYLTVQYKSVHTLNKLFFQLKQNEKCLSFLT